MIQTKILARATMFSLLGACALIAGGCGGGSTNGDTLGTTPATGPVVVGANFDNSTQTDAAGNSIPVEDSGLVTPVNPGQPSAGDIPYTTTATAITVLSGQPPIQGADSYTGAATVYNDGTANTAPVPLGTAAAFRAYIINGQNSDGNRTYVPIQSVVLTSTDPEAVKAGFTPKPLTLAFKSDGTAAGPLASATFSTATFPLPFATNGTHTFSVTIVDTAGQSSRTDFEVTVGTPIPTPVAAIKRASVKHA